MKKIPILLVTVALSSWVTSILGQGVAINNDQSEPDESAILDVSSTLGGMLVPRMTKTQRDAISNPAVGLMVFQTDSLAGYYYYAGTNWVSVESVGAGGNSSSTCIDYDSNAYPTFTIGTQTWMAENLRVTHYKNGDAITDGSDEGTWYEAFYGVYCWYDNDEAENSKYGALYNWWAVDDARGLCPEGWHVPGVSEWTVLTTYLYGESVAGGKMKSVSPLWDSPNTDATNSSGFSGLPGGWRTDNAVFATLGQLGFFWTSTDIGSEAYYRRLLYNDGFVTSGQKSWNYGFSVRCLRDY